MQKERLKKKWEEKSPQNNLSYKGQPDEHLIKTETHYHSVIKTHKTLFCKW